MDPDQIDLQFVEEASITFQQKKKQTTFVVNGTLRDI